MSLRLQEQHINEIRRHAERDYPSECCGVLLGTAASDAKEVRRTEPLRNIRREPGQGSEYLPLEDPGRESERNRFLIAPADLIRAEREARASGLEIVGYYHSHPDHPARPSGYDRDHAFPWYSYVIVSVAAGRAGAYTSWVLREDRTEFEPEKLEVLNAVAVDRPAGMS